MQRRGRSAPAQLLKFFLPQRPDFVKTKTDGLFFEPAGLVFLRLFTASFSFKRRSQNNLFCEKPFFAPQRGFSGRFDPKCDHKNKRPALLFAGSAAAARLFCRQMRGKCGVHTQKRECSRQICRGFFTINPTTNAFFHFVLSEHLGTRRRAPRLARRSGGKIRIRRKFFSRPCNHSPNCI